MIPNKYIIYGVVFYIFSIVVIIVSIFCTQKNNQTNNPTKTIDSSQNQTIIDVKNSSEKITVDHNQWHKNQLIPKLSSSNNNIPIQFYLIHGPDVTRKSRMESEFIKAKIDPINVTWMVQPNKDELTPELISQITKPWIEDNVVRNLPLGVISCTYKHYLSLKNMIDRDLPYAVIMEDNMMFKDNVPERIRKYIDQLNEYYPNWDVLFDSYWQKVTEHPVVPERLVYPKSNEITPIAGGSTRLAQCYLITLSAAKKLYEVYLPFNNPPDGWMNTLFRQLNFKVYWSEPSITDNWPHFSTAIGKEYPK